MTSFNFFGVLDNCNKRPILCNRWKVETEVPVSGVAGHSIALCKQELPSDATNGSDRPETIAVVPLQCRLDQTALPRTGPGDIESNESARSDRGCPPKAISGRHAPHSSKAVTRREQCGHALEALELEATTSKENENRSESIESGQPG